VDTEATVADLKARAIAFRDARNWAQFHDPKNLAAGLAIEAAELQELFLWKTREEVEQLMEDEGFRSRLSHEIADTAIFLLYLCHGSGIDLSDAITEKLALNDVKYPVDKSYNSSRKYNEL
jgi:NTP pyrophosphatase (non-canonical NTP hydrolase)